ncbi:MAG: hypothetical protein QNK04_25185 [Myxococcota bacterium]|nr:hypothetical protein [Myxococcota bacterium]
MKLAKPVVDVGVFADPLEPALRFWQDEVGLPFEELVPTGAEGVGGIAVQVAVRDAEAQRRLYGQALCMSEEPDGNWIELSQRASLAGPLP